MFSHRTKFVFKGYICCSSLHFKFPASCKFMPQLQCYFAVGFAFSIAFTWLFCAICPLLVQTNKASVVLTFHMALLHHSPFPETMSKGQFTSEDQVGLVLLVILLAAKCISLSNDRKLNQINKLVVECKYVSVAYTLLDLKQKEEITHSN